MRYPCRASATQSRFSGSDVASACALQFDPPDRTVLIRPLISGYPPTASPEAVAAKRRDRMERLANGIVAAIRGCFHCSETTGPSRRGRLVGVMCRTCLLLRDGFFAFRFVSDFPRRQPIVTIEQIFSDGSSETKWPSPPKRNALPKRAGKPPKGSRRNLRGTGGEKTVGRSGMASGKKTFARRDALRSCTRNSRTRSADQVRQIAASIRMSLPSPEKIKSSPSPTLIVSLPPVPTSISSGIAARADGCFDLSAACPAGATTPVPALPCVDGSCFARFF